MNKFLHTFGLTFALLLVAVQPAISQQKTAYVDTEFILSQIPEYQGVQKQLSLLSEEWKQQMQKMEQEIERMREDFAEKKLLYTEELRSEKQKEIQRKVEARQRFMEQKFGARGEYFQKQKELLEPIQRRVYEALTAVAEREGFDFIFDRSQKGEILFAREKWNLDEKVLAELGISLNQSGN